MLEGVEDAKVGRIKSHKNVMALLQSSNKEQK
jgi:hypothetical protein